MRFASVVVAAALLAGCAQPVRNVDGWWDPGIHAVDGYWVTHERRCVLQEEPECAAAVATAIDALRAREPGASVIGALDASYPVSNGDEPNEVTYAFGGLVQPRLIILELADGSRRTIAMHCGPDMRPNADRNRSACQAAEFEVWRVRGS